MARPAYERVGAAFRQTYEAAGLRQGDVAEALGVDQATVSKWARGVQRIDLEYFPEIDKLCGKRRGYLLRRAGFVDDGPIDLEQAIEMAPDLDDDGRNMLMNMYLVLKNEAARRVQDTAAETARAR